MVASTRTISVNRIRQILSGLLLLSLSLSLFRPWPPKIANAKQIAAEISLKQAALVVIADECATSDKSGRIVLDNSLGNGATHGCLVIESVSYPDARVRIYNDHSFWTKIFLRDSLNTSVEPEDIWANLRYIAPNSYAEYTFTFDTRYPDHSVIFFVNGAGSIEDNRPSAALWTIVSRVLALVGIDLIGATLGELQYVLERLDDLHHLALAADALSKRNFLLFAKELYEGLVNNDELDTIRAICTRLGMPITRSALKTIFTAAKIVFMAQDVEDMFSSIFLMESYAGQINVTSKLGNNPPTAENTPTPTPSVFSCNNVTEIPRTECEALVTFYNTTNGPHWRERVGWLDTTTPCRWHGVGCRNGHVVNLDLMYNQLNGSLPPELGNLIHLQSLTLHLNVLHGNIPPQLGNLTNLTILNLNTNHNLSGSIPPELGNLTNLRILDLSNNQLSGSLPPDIGYLQSLSELSLGGNQLSGTIPPELGNLSNLEQLFLTANQFSGPLPFTLTKLTRLNLFWFERTNLCESATFADFQNWLQGIRDVRSTGVTCPSSVVPETPTPEATLPPITTESCTGSDGVYICRILANAGWQQTPLFLPASSDYYLTYKSGTWTTNVEELRYVGLDGYLAEEEIAGEILGYGNCVLYGIGEDVFWSTGDMLGRAGGQFWPVRYINGFGTAGYLYLRINEKDECLIDNDGAIVVEISLFPPASDTASTPTQTPTEPPANSSDLKEAILERLRNAEVTTIYSQEAEQLVEALFVHLGEFGQNGGIISQEAIRQALQSDDVGIRLNAVVQGVWESWVEQGQQAGFDPGTTDLGAFEDISPFRRLIIRLIQDDQGPLSAGEQHALRNLLTRSEELQTWRDDTNGIVGAINRESFQTIQREQPTSIPTPNAPPTPLTTSASPFQILSPGDDTILRCKPQFAWQDSVGLAPGHLYEIVIWKVGEDWKKGRGVTSADLRTSRDVDLNYLDDQREWFAPGGYEWGILDITTDPYSRHSMLGYGGRFTFVRDGTCP